MKWIDGRKLSGIPVEKREGRRKNGKPYIPLAEPKAVVVHTTEGSTVRAAVDTLLRKFSAPHFVVGEDRIVQMRPLDVQGSALADNDVRGFHPNSVGWQIESVGFSSQKLHRLTPSTWRPLVAVCAFVHTEFGVPLERPKGWLENGSDITTIWAADNTRRQSRRAIGFRGFLGHLDMPGQGRNWHWDPGAFEYNALFEEIRRAVAEGEPMTPTQARIEIAAGWHSRTGQWMSRDSDETAQERLTRLAQEVVDGKRTVDAILKFAGEPKPQKSEPVPAWVLDPFAAENS